MLSVHVRVKCDHIASTVTGRECQKAPCWSSIAISTNRHFGQAEMAINGFLMEKSGLLLCVLDEWGCRGLINPMPCCPLQPPDRISLCEAHVCSPESLASPLLSHWDGLWVCSLPCCSENQTEGSGSPHLCSLWSLGSTLIVFPLFGYICHF